MNYDSTPRGRVTIEPVTAYRPGAYGRPLRERIDHVDTAGLPTISDASYRELANEHLQPIDEARIDREIAAAMRAMRERKGLPVDRNT